MQKSFKDHFSNCSAAYATFRPSYPSEFVAAIVGLCSQTELAWDVGTGNGQAAVLLADHFDRVEATDASAPQIRDAKPNPKVNYRVARERASGLADRSVDLVTVAQALHWFDLAAFYPEVGRVLKRDGVLAVWTYNHATIDAVVDPLYEDFYANRMGRYWNPERRHVLTCYRDLPFPYPEIPLGTWQATANLTRDDLLGYVGTWSAVANARKAEGADPVPELTGALRRVWPDGVKKVVTWPLTVRVGRKLEARPVGPG